MELTLKQEELLLKSFTDWRGVDKTIQSYAKIKDPFLHEAYDEVWATNSHIMIAIKKELIKGTYPVQNKPKYKPAYTDAKEKAILKIEDLAKVVDKEKYEITDTLLLGNTYIRARYMQKLYMAMKSLKVDKVEHLWKENDGIQVFIPCDGVEIFIMPVLYGYGEDYKKGEVKQERIEV